MAALYGFGGVMCACVLSVIRPYCCYTVSPERALPQSSERYLRTTYHRAQLCCGWRRRSALLTTITSAEFSVLRLGRVFVTVFPSGSLAFTIYLPAASERGDGVTCGREKLPEEYLDLRAVGRSHCNVCRDQVHLLYICVCGLCSFQALSLYRILPSH